MKKETAWAELNECLCVRMHEKAKVKIFARRQSVWGHKFSTFSSGFSGRWKMKKKRNDAKEWASIGKQEFNYTLDEKLKSGPSRTEFLSVFSDQFELF